MKKKYDGTYEFDEDEKPSKIEYAFAVFIAFFFLLPLVMLGIIILKLFGMEDWMTEKIAKYFDGPYSGGCRQ